MHGSVLSAAAARFGVRRPSATTLRGGQREGVYSQAAPSASGNVADPPKQRADLDKWASGYPGCDLNYESPPLEPAARRTACNSACHCRSLDQLIDLTLRMRTRKGDRADNDRRPAPQCLTEAEGCAVRPAPVAVIGPWPPNIFGVPSWKAPEPCDHYAAY